MSINPRRIVGIIVFLSALIALPSALRAETVRKIRHSSDAERTRVVLDLDAAPDFTHRPLANPPRVVVELPHGGFASTVKPFGVGDGYVRGVRLNSLRSGRIQVVLDLERGLDYSVLVLGDPPRIVVDVKHAGAPPARVPVADDDPPAREPQPPAEPVSPEPETQETGAGVSEPGRERTEEAPPQTEPPRTSPAPAPTVLPPREGPWVIAVDAGHGGQDHGARYHGTSEKDITLKLARELVKELDERPNIEAFLVRKGDYFIPLYQRRALAEEHGADLFVSLHCNASRKSSAAGTEVFFLSLKGASDEKTRELERMENEVDEKMGVEPPDENLEKILFSLSQTNVLTRSSELALACHDALIALGTVYDRGVKQAGFAVLKSPSMPSVLVEAAFLSNQAENRLLKNGKWQRDFGRLMADGIEEYCRSLDRADHVDGD